METDIAGGVGLPSLHTRHCPGTDLVKTRVKQPVTLGGKGSCKGRHAVGRRLMKLLLETQIKLPWMCNSHLTGLRCGTICFVIESRSARRSMSSCYALLQWHSGGWRATGLLNQVEPWGIAGIQETLIPDSHFSFDSPLQQPHCRVDSFPWSLWWGK